MHPHLSCGRVMDFHSGLHLLLVANCQHYDDGDDGDDAPL
jgi:hypothetical protein